MSIKIASLVWEHYPTGGGELLTALAYADHADDAGMGIRPSVAYIARKTRQSERTVQMHLAKMRESSWLMTVRHAKGGRGRATEYRVNPAWIANPEKFAPNIHKPKRVQSSAEKGADRRTKGCKAFAPQPLRTIIEPTTTHAHDEERAPLLFDDLAWPELFDGPLRASAAKILTSCPVQYRQLVLHEIAGISLKSKVRHPLGLLRKLVESAGQNNFAPSAALEYLRKLERESEEKQAKLDDQRLRIKQTTPEARKEARSKLAELRKAISG